MIRRLLIHALAGCTVALACGGCAGVNLDKMRTDFIALRSLDEAMQATVNRPPDRQRALRRIRRALTLAPTEPVIVATAPRILALCGEYQEAARLLSRQQDPDPVLLGQCLLKLGQQEAGARLLLDAARRAQQLFAARRISQFTFAMELNNAAYTLADAGLHLDLARSMLETVTDILPLEPNCVDSLGWVYYRLGDTRRAIFYLERAVRQQGRSPNPEVLYHLGAAYAREGRHARAARMLRTALRLDPGLQEAQQELHRLKWLLPGTNYVCGESCTAPRQG